MSELTKIIACEDDEPRLIVQLSNLPATAQDVCDLLAKSGMFFDRGVPTRITPGLNGGLPTAQRMTNHNVVMAVHQLATVYKMDRVKGLVPMTLPNRVADMYLAKTNEWNLEPLAGISTAPLLNDEGDLRTAVGYDRKSELFCSGVPQLVIPLRLSRRDAEQAFFRLRRTFRTFPFADSPRVRDDHLGISVVDLARSPAVDESCFLVGLLTAICRPSLHLAPALAITAPAVSGAGNGKGLLARAISVIAFGVQPRAFTPSSERQELDKRLAAELVEAHPVLFLDNVNGVALRSDTLASVLTERPARVRLLGVTRMVLLNSSAFVVITGNGLTLSEDLARRFLVCELDAGCEDPEVRPFAPGFLKRIEHERNQLLADAIIVWRWGRQNADQLMRGKPLGSFEDWAAWCRDPLIALGCCDPVDRVAKLKGRDPRRQYVAEVFAAWWAEHASNPVKISELAESVSRTADPHQRGRQYLATVIGRLAGTRAAGFVLERQEAIGKWSGATYTLRPTDDGTHRAHWVTVAPETPMGPTRDDGGGLPAGAEAEI